MINMKKIILITAILSLLGCSTSSPKRETYDLINTEMSKIVSEAQVRAASPDAVSASLLPPLKMEAPGPRQPVEQRFNLAFNNLPAAQFFMTQVSGTRYSMLVPPEVTGTISANLKDVTIFEALDAIREMYGYDYKVEGTRIYIKPLPLQTRVFQVNYLTGTRNGTSDIRVTSGSVSDVAPGSTTTTTTTTTTTKKKQTTTTNKNTTRSNSDFWSELKFSLEAIVGSG